jgi:hypothetical protein
MKKKRLAMAAPVDISPNQNRRKRRSMVSHNNGMPVTDWVEVRSVVPPPRDVKACRLVTPDPVVYTTGNIAARRLGI